jgi:hypothetical protein
MPTVARRILRLSLSATLLAACHAPVRNAAEPVGAPWLKGQTHLHSSSSHDSKAPPAEVARFYADHGYDFIVFTDHDFVTRLPGHLEMQGAMLILPGAELTQNLPHCEPPPDDAVAGCKLHVNALFAGRAGPVTLPPAKPANSVRRIDLYQRALDEARDLGAIPQLNHPRTAHAVDAALMIELARRGVVLVEIANQGHVKENRRDGALPSTEDLWDAALTAGATVWGVASDDAHQYSEAEIAEARARGDEPMTGDHGWVMVRARRDPEAIRQAILQGDFYSSTGVTLTRVERAGGALVIEAAGGPHHFTFVGAGGRTLAESDGDRARFPLDAARGGYVRAVVSDAAGHRAWTQPVRVPGN